MSAAREKLLRILYWKRSKKPSFPKIMEHVSKKCPINELSTNKVILTQISFPEEIENKKELKVSGVNFEKCIFSHSNITKYDFHDCNFIECSFNGSIFYDCEFHNCVFSECTFFKTSFSSTYIDPTSFRFSSRWHWNWANINVWLFQSLYRNSKDMHQEKFAMHADKKFQFYKRYDDLLGKKPHFIKFFKSLFYDYALGYGYGIKNALIITSASVTLFAYTINGHLANGNIGFFKALYFSIVSLTTVGYGEMTPNLQLFPMSLTIIFLIFSMIWCAVVTAIIVKRIVR